MNGLLEVDMELSAQNHPIHQLIRDAKGEWEAKNARQSQDLKGAVNEYRRRNGGRNPPKGFDKWWEYQRSVIDLVMIKRVEQEGEGELGEGEA